ncbi:hypothetical protein DPEC_G00275200 [Dallia pectoralis]|uniref:Uncharacterized protein n=1 Tax=Dallia pectoralis TaxID=75939 RepID=A0ACC2FLI4_DALPE|nr:hypothetical protein DPEC_G00275200 [Dallia pectoralis]
MSSVLWVQLALLAGCLRSGVTEGDPLPPGLVELVRNSPISSIEDLHLLLFSDSVGGDEDEDVLLSGSQSNNTSNRLPRSLDAQPAQQAQCKVRTEVAEVTRAMLDRSNANFLLWPPCVEVQRCSGCCNAKSLQCVPVVVHTRHLQVMKIQYVEKRPIYSKAVVSVLDHVECRCHPAPRPQPPAKKKATPRRPHKDNRPEARIRSKEELHRDDEQKQNQQRRLEDMLDQHWKPRNTSSHPGNDGLEHDEMAPQWVRNATRQLGAAERTEPELGADRRAVDDDDANRSLDQMKRAGTETGGVSLIVDNGGRGEIGGDPPPCTHTPKQLFHEDYSSPPETQSRHESRGGAGQTAEQRPTEATNQSAGNGTTPGTEADQRRKDNETPELEGRWQHTLLEEERRLEEEERKELLSLHRRLDVEKELLRQQKDEEWRMNEQHLQNHREPPPTTTPITGTVSTSTTRPPPTTAPAARPTARPAPQRKKTRKNNRKRISKAAMRAMLM